MSVNPYDSNLNNYYSSLNSISGDNLTPEEISMFENYLNIDESQVVMNQGYNTFTLNDLTKEDNELIIAALEEQYEEIEQEFETAKNSNGWISGAWNAIKNFTGIGASSNKTQKELDNMKKQLDELKKNPEKLSEVYKNITGKELTSEELTKFVTGETSLMDSSKAGESVNKYSEGQKMSTDIVADIVSGIVSVGAVAIGSAVGICAAPFTAGASLGLVAAGIGIGAAAGATVKVALKGSDCIGNEKKYELKDLGYDLVTGSINGAMGPVSNALGGAAGTTAMKAMGMEALETTVKGAAAAAGKEVVEEAAEAVVKNTAKTTLKKVVATGADLVVDGAFSGATDGFARALGEGRIEDIPQDMLAGAAGGAIASPIIGGGFKIAGKAGSKIGNVIKNSDVLDNIADTRLYTAASELKSAASSKIDDVAGKLKTSLKNTKLGTKITNDYEIAKANFLNIPEAQSADTKVVQEMSSLMKDLSEFVSAEDALGGKFNNLKTSINALADSSLDLSTTLLDLNDELSNTLKNKTAGVKELLEAISRGENVSDKLSEFAKKGIDITELFDEKTLGLLDSFDAKLQQAVKYQEGYIADIQALMDFPSQHADDLQGFVTQASDILSEIPDTNAFKQLGELPDRLSKTCNDLQGKIKDIQSLADTAKKQIMSGQLDEGYESLNAYYDELTSFQDVLSKTAAEGQDCAERAGLVDTFNTLKTRIEDKIGTDNFSSLSSTAKAQSIVEESNIAFSKFIQTMSSDESLPPSVRSFFKEFTSNCTVTRNLDEAQILADELYGAGKYTVKKSFGAGTIGETYLVTDADGKEFVMKMLKKGVTEEKFEADRAMFTKYLEEFVTDEADKEYKLKLINGLFDSWEKELDYGAEALGAKQMQEGASRFGVAQTVELGTQNGKNISLIMEKADGVGLDTLLDLLKFKGEHPDDYLTLSILSDEGKELNPWIKNQGLIEQNSWIKDTESYREALPVAYQKAQNEQAMFISASGEKTVHADPHGGNVFVGFDPETKTPKITYIDTGNVITRTNSEVLSDISLSLNMMIGNSEGIATSLLKGATLPSGVTQEEMIKKVADLLDERLYKAGVNLKDVNYTQSTMMGILKELNIIPDAGNSNLLKANLQRIKTSREIFAVTGTEANKAVDIKDMLKGIAKSFKSNPKETYQTIKPIIKWAFKNSDQSLITFFQMMLKNSDFEKELPSVVK